MPDMNPVEAAGENCPCCAFALGVCCCLGPAVGIIHQGAIYLHDTDDGNQPHGMFDNGKPIGLILDNGAFLPSSRKFWIHDNADNNSKPLLTARSSDFNLKGNCALCYHMPCAPLNSLYMDVIEEKPGDKDSEDAHLRPKATFKKSADCCITTAIQEQFEDTMCACLCPRETKPNSFTLDMHSEQRDWRKRALLMALGIYVEARFLNTGLNTLSKCIGCGSSPDEQLE